MLGETKQPSVAQLLEIRTLSIPLSYCAGMYIKHFFKTNLNFGKLHKCRWRHPAKSVLQIDSIA
jgi:hypothetical protein